MVKSNKSVLSRVRITKNNKVIVRKKGHGHFNAKQSSSKRLAKKRTHLLVESPKVRQRFLYK